ncbi:MAG: hypothetical protein HY868_24290 [Chloroflexi bacterium]|nr:hypothetical protein [Chloroflexota bacterium]
MDATTINIADIPTTLVRDEFDADIEKHIVEHYSAFVVPPRSDALAVRLHVEPGPPYIPLDISPTWQIHTERHGDRIDFESYYEKGWADLATCQGELILRPQGTTENFLRVLYAWRCMEENLLLLHAAGIISHGRGFVFFGPSGNGKTTVTTFSMDRTVLSDDMVILKKRDDRYYLYGVPFRGDMPEAPRTNASAELCGAFTLVKAAEHRLEPLAASQAVAQMARCVPFVMTVPAHTRRVMEICQDIVATVPVRALHFRRDAEFWRILDGLE